MNVKIICVIFITWFYWSLSFIKRLNTYLHIIWCHPTWYIFIFRPTYRYIFEIFSVTRINPILILWWHWQPIDTAGGVFTTHAEAHSHTFPLCGIEPVFTATPSILPWLLCTSWRPHGARWLVHWWEIVHCDGRSLKGLIFVSTIHLCWGVSEHDAELLLTSALLQKGLLTLLPKTRHCDKQRKQRKGNMLQD